MVSYDDLRASALELFELVITAARRADAQETLRRLQAARDRLEASLLTVVVCGEFSRGKSTLLNALLDQRQDDPLFPVGISYTTSLVTTVAYGDTERITVQRVADETASTQDHGQEVVVSRAQLLDYVTQSGNPENRKRVLSVSIQLPSDTLASGLALVDTPGIGGVYTEHTAVTDEVLPLADAIVFVADVQQPLTGSELRFLRRAVEAAGVGDDRDALICVLTKIDLVADYEEIVASTQAKLAAATGWPRVAVVPVSSQAKLDYLASHDEADLIDSNFRELRRVLWDTLGRRRARAILASAVQDVDGAAAALLTPIETQIGAVRAVGPEAAEVLREAVETRRRDLAGLAVAAATWRGDLDRDVDSMARDVVRLAMQNADRAWRNVPGYLADNALLDNPDRLFQRIDEDLSVITGMADRTLYERAARLQRELAGKLGLDLGPVEMRRLPPAPVPALRETRPPTDVPPVDATSPTPASPRPTGRGDLRTTSSVMSISTTVGSVLGRVIEMFVAPGGGAIIGGALGATAGLLVSSAVRLARWRNPNDAVRRQPRGAVRRQLAADLDEHYHQTLRPHFTSHVRRVAREWGAAIAAEIDSRIRQEQASAAESARRVSEPLPVDAERAAALEAALTAEAEPLRGARRGAANLARAAAELATYGES